VFSSDVTFVRSSSSLMFSDYSRHFAVNSCSNNCSSLDRWL